MVSIIEMQRRRIARLEREALQHVEHLDQQHAAGGRRRHRDDVVAAVACRAAPGARPRGSSCRSSRGHQPAGGAHRGGDLARRPAPRRTRAGRRGRWRASVAARSVCTRRSPARERRAVGRRKIFADDGQRANRARAYGSESAMSSSTGMPSRASAIAGAISCAQREPARAVFRGAPARAPRPCPARRSRARCRAISADRPRRWSSR